MVVPGTLPTSHRQTTKDASQHRRRAKAAKRFLTGYAAALGGWPRDFLAVHTLAARDHSSTYRTLILQTGFCEVCDGRITTASSTYWNWFAEEDARRHCTELKLASLIQATSARRVAYGDAPHLSVEAIRGGLAPKAAAGELRSRLQTAIAGGLPVVGFLLSTKLHLYFQYTFSNLLGLPLYLGDARILDVGVFSRAIDIGHDPPEAGDDLGAWGLSVVTADQFTPWRRLQVVAADAGAMYRRRPDNGVEYEARLLARTVLALRRKIVGRD